MTLPCLPAEDYTVGWVCALPVEHAAAALMLDEEHENPPKHATDTNVYLLGRICGHNVVIVCLPLGRVGTNSAAAVASQMRSTFVSIEFVRMVGIGGGVPSAQADIRLGDVVISQPNSQYHGVVQYDFGKIGPGGHLTRTGSLNAPPTILLSALATFQSNHLICKSDLSVHLSQLISHQDDFSLEKAGSDILFEPDYDHTEGQTCDQCNRDRIMERPSRGGQEPVVHYGTIASGNVVMKDGVTRDLWSKNLGGVLCFEMEAAGLMNSFPCLVVRGICDYADSHKNKTWQPYAAATAAACAKDLLSVIPSVETIKTRM
jgi:nucleoside phosphorylase